MRFVLVYRGELPASQRKGRPDIVRQIREQFHPQLETLWSVSPALKRLRQTAVVPTREGFATFGSNTPLADMDESSRQGLLDGGWVDLTSPVSIKGRNFMPLVRSELSLTCRLNIQFLRADEPGNLFNGAGDVDNRIKTLFDALEAPAEDSLDAQFSEYDLTYCLLENDKLITDFSVETERLLLPDTASQKEVHLVIEVLIDVNLVGPWNLCLVRGGA